MELSALNGSQIKELATRLHFETEKADRAGLDTEILDEKLQAALQELADRKIWARSVFTDADERFIAHIRASREPGFTCEFDLDGTASEAAVAQMVAVSE
jgi:cell division FtsZ-interacting protein ZapD